jgi:phage terminase small subunit
LTGKKRVNTPVTTHSSNKGDAASPLLPSGTEDAQDLEPSAPCTPSPHLLSPAHQRFCQEYAVDLNGAKAYQRAYPEATYSAAASSAYELLKNPHIGAEIQRLLDERAQITGITADRVLLKLWEMGTADPRELVEVRIGCCRHCWGLYHQYQFTDAELEKAEHEHIQKEAKRRKAEKDDFKPEPFRSKGGSGFDRNRQPNPECPECGGDGTERAIVKDTRNLSEGALRLFGGVKTDKDGRLQVIVRDPTPALVKIGEHLGLWSDKLPGPQHVNPLAALLEAIRGTHGTGAALPIVHDDPELRDRPPAADVEDVQAKEPAQAKPAPKGWKAAS